MGSGSFQEVKRPGRGVDHPPPSGTEVKERAELYLYPSLGLRGLFYGELYLSLQKPRDFSNTEYYRLQGYYVASNSNQRRFGIESR
jgi:hypothetical protein